MVTIDSDGGDPLLPNLQVVVFLINSNRPPTSAGGDVQPDSGKRGLLHEDSYAKSLLPMLCQSVSRLYERARFTILTTPTTKLPELPFPTDIVA